jgi:hypothetical protein
MSQADNKATALLRRPKKHPPSFLGDVAGLWPRYEEWAKGFYDLISNQVAFTTSERHKGFQEEPKRSID